MAANSSNSSLPQCHRHDATCWICFDGEQPLRRDCSCRGDSAGFVHVSCLVDYAKQISRQNGGKKKFVESWRICPSCRQPYQNELAVDLATEFVAFVEKEYPSDQGKLLEALKSKLYILFGIDTLPEKEGEIEVIANKMLSMIEKMKLSNPLRMQRLQQIEADTFNRLGLIALKGGTKEIAKLALEYFEKCRDIFAAIGDDDESAVAEHNLALARLKLNVSKKFHINDSVGKWQECYKKRVAKFGEGHESTIGSGLQLCMALQRDCRSVEAGRLMPKLAATCRQVHGPNHKLTKQTESKLQACTKRYVAMIWYRAMKYQHAYEWKLFQGIYFQKWTYFEALRYEADGEKCVLRGPIAKEHILDVLTTPRNVESEKTFMVDSKDVHILLNTPVVCHGLSGSTSNLNGRIGDARHLGGLFHGEIKVHFEGSDLDSHHLVKRENLRVLFDLPDHEKGPTNNPFYLPDLLGEQFLPDWYTDRSI
eukprot:CAMPEP_0184446440 /NCGR_PEP_ID=MMETSP0740-20130409/2924_1 /TAXON_ID=385413 /ORGANISM="Thalassiosira miniscula, Strain CCMP1093" /LENGTH=479 /DNA_ID=CAMNT_0026815777 /DNA_START=55 /DNA_END=1494 /DNA_ORIENTATION=-